MPELYPNNNDLPYELPAAPRGMRELLPATFEIIPSKYFEQRDAGYTEAPIVAGEGRRPVTTEMPVVSPPFGVQQFDAEPPAQHETANTTEVDETIRDAFDRHPDFKDLVTAGGETTASISLEHRSPQGVAYLKAFSTGQITARFVDSEGQSFHGYGPDQEGVIRRDDIDVARLMAGLPQSGELSTVELWEIQQERLRAEYPNLVAGREMAGNGRSVSRAEVAYIAGLMRQAEPELVPLKELDRLSVVRIGNSAFSGPSPADAARAADEFGVTMRRFLEAMEYDPDQAGSICIEADFVDPRGGFMLVQAGQRRGPAETRSPFVRIRFDQDLNSQAIRTIFGGGQFADVPAAKSRIDLEYTVAGGVLQTSRASTLADRAGTLLRTEPQRTAMGDVAEVRKLRGFLRHPTIW